MLLMPFVQMHFVCQHAPPDLAHSSRPNAVGYSAPDLLVQDSARQKWFKLEIAVQKIVRPTVTMRRGHCSLLGTHCTAV